MHLFDSHCHLQDERIIKGIDGVVARAEQAGISAILCCASSEQDWEQVLYLASKYELVIPAFGIHPWYIGKRSDKWLVKLERLLNEVPQAAVGEIGLDHALQERNDSDQAAVFCAQLKLAKRLKRPVSIHCRRAWGDLVGILKQENGIPCGGAIHCFSGSPQIVVQLQKYDLSISFSGSVTYDRNHRAHESVKRVSADSLLVETDSPDIAPQGISGHNEPSNIVSVVNKIARLRNSSPEEIGDMTYKNGMRLFKAGY